LIALRVRLGEADANQDSRPTDFWGPASNFGIPIAAVMDTQKDAEM
jgi:Mitochondrial pyruvate carriers